MASTTTRIRPARLADAVDLAKVHGSAWRGAYLGIISGLALERMVARRGASWWAGAIRRKNEILVLDCDKVVAGYATLGPSRLRSLPYRGEIYEIYLMPEYQGLGFGRRLFQAGRDTLGRYGLQTLVVRVLADNEPACRFYESVGGRKVAEMSDYVGPDPMPISIYAWSAA